MVTEPGGDDFEDVDVPLEVESDVDSLLTTRNVHSGAIKAAGTAGGERADVELYQQHFFYRPLPSVVEGGTQQHGAPPLPTVPEEPECARAAAPFRPSSPPMLPGAFAESPPVDEEAPFRPSSPVF